MLSLRHASHNRKGNRRPDRGRSGQLPEGATVTILATEDGEAFELNSSDEAAILAAIAEAERGEVINASDVLAQINNS